MQAVRENIHELVNMARNVVQAPHVPAPRVIALPPPPAPAPAPAPQPPMGNLLDLD